MKLLFLVLVCFWSQILFAQRLDIISLEKILNAPVRSADTLLRNHKFNLADKEVGKGYTNYYYTSYERKDLVKHLLRSISFMDVYQEEDTARLILYRTYEQNEQEDLKMQLSVNGYQLISSTANTFVYKKEDYTITNKITVKTAKGNKPVTAYEFELGR
ncbi:MAG TPA: hypothetical protein VF144_04400 [Chitinophagaceae bacterium]